MMKSCCFETCCVRLRLTQYLRTRTDSASSVCSSWRRKNQNKNYFLFLFEIWSQNSTLWVQNMWNSDFECCWYLQTSKAAQKWFNSGSSTTAVRPDMAAAASTGYRGRLRSSRRDRGSDEKYSDINGRLSRKTGRPGHCHYIQVKSIQNLNFLFEYVFWNLKNFTFWIVYLQLLLVLKANVSQENRVFCFKTQGI